MRGKIPINLIEDYIRGSGWNPDVDYSKSNFQHKVNINDIINGNTIGGENILYAFKNALDFAGDKGYVVTMPELIEARVNVHIGHDIWSNMYFTHSEETLGLDNLGRFGHAGDPVLVVVHGGGLLTPNTIEDGFTNGLVGGGVNNDDLIFDNLLGGSLPGSSSIDLFGYDQIRNGVDVLPRRFGVVIPYSNFKDGSKLFNNKFDFMGNPLIIARNGGLRNLEEYFNKAVIGDSMVVGSHLTDIKTDLVFTSRMSFISELGLDYISSGISHGNVGFLVVGYNSSNSGKK